MALSEAELTRPASERYAISVTGRDAVFLVDRCLGHRLYMGAGKPLSRPELRRHVDSLSRDLRRLSIGDFLTKHGLRG